jgi:hypothetical protein
VSNDLRCHKCGALGVVHHYDCRADLIEQVARIIAGPGVNGEPDDETWKHWTEEAEAIVDLLRPEVGE